MKLAFEKQVTKDVFSSVIIGPEGTLKTGTMLESPSPTVLISTDMGYTAAVNRAIKDFGAKIHVEKILMPEIEFTYEIGGGLHFDHKAVTETWLNAKKVIKAAREHKDVKTIVIDIGGDLQKLCRAAHFGKLTQVKPHHYGPPNADFAEVFQKLTYEYGCDKNVHVICHTKKRYVKGKNDEGVWDGTWELDGPDALLKEFDVVVYADRPGNINGREQVRWTISKARDNFSVVGQELYYLMDDEDGGALESGELSFAELKSRVLG